MTDKDEKEGYRKGAVDTKIKSMDKDINDLKEDFKSFRNFLRTLAVSAFGVVVAELLRIAGIFGGKS